MFFFADPSGNPIEVKGFKDFDGVRHLTGDRSRRCGETGATRNSSTFVDRHQSIAAPFRAHVQGPFSKASSVPHRDHPFFPTSRPSSVFEARGDLRASSSRSRPCST